MKQCDILFVDVPLIQL